MRNRTVVRMNRIPGHIGTLLLLVLAAGVCTAKIGGVPTMEELRNLTYLGIYDYPVPLSGGVYEGRPFVEGGAARPRVQLAEALHARGDLDGDGVDEAVVLLTESSGGSGEYTYLAVVSRHGGQPRNVATRLIGDRIKVRSLTVEKGQVVLEFVATGPGEAACCPTQKRRDTYRLEGGELKEVASEALGQVSVADIEGVTWRLTRLAWNAPVPEGVEITAQFTEGKVAGKGGCNRYFAKVTATGPTEITIGKAGATMMACPSPAMETEHSYLDRLGRVNGFGFLLGQLALSYSDGGNLGILLFAPEK